MKIISKITLYFFTCILFLITLFLPPSTYSADVTVTLGWDANTETHLAGYYIYYYYKTGSPGAPYNGTGAFEGPSPIQVPKENLLNPNNPEYVIHGLSDTETTYFALTAYDTGGNESGYSNEVFYQPPATLTLTSLTINGDDSVNENSNVTYTATAAFSDNSTQTVTGSATWSENENSTYASISNGVLTTLEVPKDETVTFQASYTYEGVTKTGTKAVTIIDVPVSNLPPNIPNIVYPEDRQDKVETPLNIVTGPFSDPNYDAHKKSQWVIIEKTSFSFVVDITSEKYLTKFPVPHMVLKSAQTYYVLVRFYDFYNTVSGWSLVEFTTAEFADANEVDNTVDLNRDDISDNSQPEIIKCIQALDGSGYIGVEKVSDSISQIQALEMIDPLDILDTVNITVNWPNNFIIDLVSYRLLVNSPGATATVRIYFSRDIPESYIFFKYDTINGWYDYSEHTTLCNEGNPSFIMVELKDGSYGDSDGLANGLISNMVGIASYP